MTDDEHLHDLPDPLVPADVDLTGLGFMPMQLRVMSSTLFVKSTGEEFKAAFALWCASWHEKPAATLPNDPVMLAYLARVDAETWTRVSRMSLHGWSKRSDGRLHHEVLAPLALGAWEKRAEYREERQTRETRQQRWRDKVKRLSRLLRENNFAPPRGATLASLVDLCVRHVPGFDPEVETAETSQTVSTGRRDEIGKRERGQRQDSVSDSKATAIGTEGNTAARKSAPKVTPKASRRRSADDSDTRGTRIPKDWVLPATFGNWAVERFPHWSPETVRSIGETFRDHWSAKPGRDGLKLDWLATWRNWCKSSITQRDFPPPRGRGNGHHPAPTAATSQAKAARVEQLVFGSSGQGVIDAEH